MDKVAGTSNNGKGGRPTVRVDVGSPLLDWEEVDHFSFEDSERFEEDSLCSWSSEPESLCNNWRGWKRPIIIQPVYGNRTKRFLQEKAVASLGELAAKCVACNIPFELVEHVYPPVPEQLQLQIAFWSFPDSEDDVRLYSCLANGSSDEFQRGEHLFRDRAVKDVLQIGFHLSATVVLNMPRAQFNVAVTFDRQRISSCNCTCASSAHWCSHIVAVCLFRIHLPTQVCLRAPVSESLQRLRRDQLQKFAQYLISELPRQVLPTAQRILDELLSAQPNQINATCGAPDPTAGASAYEFTSWFLDERTLHNNINKILVKFCVPAPIVFSDVNYLSTSAPPAAAEWTSLLRPLRGREPEGMWNLLSIVREMIMACEQIIVWWYSTKAALVAWSGSGSAGGKHGAGGNSAAQHACSSLCDEMVVLWRLAALNPSLAPHERDTLHEQFAQWHTKVLDKVAKNRNNLNMSSTSHTRHSRSHTHSPYISGISESEVFPGFHPAMEACFLEWDDYQIPGVTYSKDLNPLYHSPFTIFRHTEKHNDSVHQVHSSKAVLNNEMSLNYRLSSQEPVQSQPKKRHLPPPRLCAASHRLTNLASITLAKCDFLCTVLSEFSEHHELAFRVGLYALEMSRPPASTKSLEVKLSNQETELVALLRKLPIGKPQLALAREKAEQLRDGVLRNRGTLLPIALASFLFEALVASVNDKEIKHTVERLPSDEILGFEAAVAALGLKANVSEAEHPLLQTYHYHDWTHSNGTINFPPIYNCVLLIPLLLRSERYSGYIQCLYYLMLHCVFLVCYMHISDHITSSRYKGKRVYPSVPNQPSEASAHFMFELAKSVLFKAGGSSSTSLFTQTTCAREEPQGPHRGLHMAAFQLGLYALGLHNCVSANWLSRTYSSHVSWITGQAMDIGAPAILFLIDAWEGHLTPPEAAGIADKASSGRDVHIVRAAAELALSVLPHAHALNYNEIQRAVLQCKEQSDAMLERACLTVEAAAKGGGVYPEVLYTVARYWHELYLRQGTEEEAAEEPQYRAPPPLPMPVSYALPYPFTYHPYPPHIYQLQYGGAPPPHPAPPYAMPQYFVRGIVAPPHPHAHAHASHAAMPQHVPHASHQPLPALPALPAHPAHQPHSLPPPIPVNHPAPIPPPIPATHTVVAGVGTVSAVGAVNSVTGVGNVTNVGTMSNVGNMANVPNIGNMGNSSNMVNVSNMGNVSTIGNVSTMGNVNNMGNVSGMGNMGNMGNVGLIGNMSNTGNVGNMGSGVVVNMGNMGNVSNVGSVPPGAAGLNVLTLVCRYIQCIHQKLYHLTPLEYEEFVGIVLSARTAFQLTPEGHTQFKEWLASLRRSKSCKKDLWTQLNAALQTNGK
ncbi:PREDICTED: zinc finger SWIM domain-containing protein 8-like [Papilio polytes]|uniref:zinc finger SWIM domain-containing protein 8-like n=1 Tax=Papilio polytes TaxID=76194 RepID=UPI0006764216|nr:PREDICTED: zinc finger SWIM domain-containing protein 8-like [Papilio polytes]